MLQVLVHATVLPDDALSRHGQPTLRPSQPTFEGVMPHTTDLRYRTMSRLSSCIDHDNSCHATRRRG